VSSAGRRNRRLKYRRDRRYGMKIDPVACSTTSSRSRAGEIKIYARLAWQAGASASSQKRSQRHEYMDLALSPVIEEDLDKLALFADVGRRGASPSARRDLARAKVAAGRNVQRLAAAE